MNEPQNIFEKIKAVIELNKIYLMIILFVIITASVLLYIINKPVTEASLVFKAENDYKQGKIAYAIDGYSYIVRAFPDNYDAHIRLAELYLETNDKDSAKIEYMRAIKLGYNKKYDAYLALADIYVKENKFLTAEHFVEAVKKFKDSNVISQIGNFYYTWGESVEQQDKTEALRKYIIAYKYYKAANDKKNLSINEKIKNIYVQIADDLIKSKKVEAAISTLKISLKYKDEADVHNYLARAYLLQGKTELALTEYSVALKLDKHFSGLRDYVALLIIQAEDSTKKGDKVTSELYYTMAKKLNPALKVPFNPDKRLVLNIISTRYNQNIDKDILTPGITLKVTNISNEKISDIKIKVIFKESNIPISEVINIIANSKKALDKDSSTQEINILSTKILNHIFDEHNLTAQIFISQQTPDKWVLYRNLSIQKEKNSIIFTP